MPSIRWTLAIATVAIAWLLRPGQLLLTDPVSCGGLADAAVVVAARLRPDTPILQFLSLLNGAMVIGAWLVFWRLAAHISASPGAASAATLAFAFNPVFDRLAAPTSAIGVLVVALAGLLLAKGREIASRRDRLMTLGALGLLAFTVPRLTIPAALIALGWPSSSSGVTPTRSWRMILALVVIVAGAAGVAVVPDLPRPDVEGDEAQLTCLLPAASAGASSLTRVTRTLILQLGPVPLVAALVGIFRVRAFAGTTRGIVLSLAVLLTFVWIGDPAASASPFAMILVGVWCLAACGVAEMLAALGTTAARRTVGVAMAAMVPLLQFSRAGGDDAELADRVRGHDRLTASAMARILSTTPSGAVLIVDDAISDLLARSQAHTRRVATRGVLFASMQSADLLAGEQHRVLLMPRAQFVLGNAGYDVRTDLQPRVSGIAELGRRSPCQEITSDWTRAVVLSGSTRIAAVATGPDQQGPAQIYLGLNEWSEPRPLDWPDAARRGLTGRTYDPGRSADALAVARWRQRDQAPDDPVVFGAPIVVRLEWWRAAGGLTILPIDVGRPIVGMLTRLKPDVQARPLRVCPAFAGEIEPLQ